MTPREKQLLAENESLRNRLAEAEEALDAIRNGEVDAIVVSAPEGEKIFSLTSAETPYRIILEEMNEGTVSVTKNGLILYCNNRFSAMVCTPMEQVFGSNFSVFIRDEERPEFEKLLQAGLDGRSQGEFTGSLPGEQAIFFHLSLRSLPPEVPGDLFIIVTDITKRKNAEAEINKYHEHLEEIVALRTRELGESETRLSIAQKAARAGVWDWHIVTNKLTWTPEFFELFGMDPMTPEANFDLWRSVVHPDDLPLAEKTILDSVRDHTTLENDYRIILPSGKIQWIRAIGNTLYDEKDQPVRMSGLCIDITGQKLMEQALQVSEKKYRELVRHAPAGIYEIDFRNQKFVTVNDAMTELSGYSREELLEMNPLDILEEESRLLYQSRLERMARGEKPPETVEYKTRKKDGNIITVLLNTSLKFDSSGKPVGAMVVGHDISERKRMESMLTTTLQRFYLMLGSMYSGTLLMTEEGTVEFVNQAFCNFYMLKESPEELVGLPSAEFLDKIKPAFLDPEKAVERIREILKIGKPVMSEEFPLSNGTTAIRDYIPLSVGGVSCGRLWIHRDITQRKTTELEIRNLSVNLEQLVKERTIQLQAVITELEEYNYSIAHDLRAPLRHISGYIGLLGKSLPVKLDEKTRKYMENISGAAEKMGNLVDSILTFSRMNRAPISFTDVSISELVEECRNTLKEEINDRQIIWKIDPLPVVHGDKDMLSIVLTNFLSNAIKFTRPKPDPMIEIGCSKDNGNHEVIIFVRDNGVGFEMKYSHKLFKLFERLHNDSSLEGIGLGLANSRRIIQRHGGRTWAEGSKNQGATFFFSLPGK
jgi:PAS domain S-box-containing protein